MWTTVETGATAGGVADSNYLMKGGREGWVEYKKVKANAIRFQPEQIGWHLRRARYGGVTWIAVREVFDGGSRREACDRLHMISGRFVEELAKMGLACGRGTMLGDGGPTAWNWRMARQLLVAPYGGHNPR
jgi:hypothetical protein